MRDIPVPDQQEEPAWRVWVRLSGLRCGAAGGQQVSWNVNVSAEVKAHCERSCEARAAQLAPYKQGLHTGLSSACFCKVHSVCLGLGCFAAFLVAAVSSQKIVHVEKALFCPLFLHKSIYLLWYCATFPDMVRVLCSNNTACLVDIKQLCYMRLFNCIFLCC